MIGGQIEAKVGRGDTGTKDHFIARANGHDIDNRIDAITKIEEIGIIPIPALQPIIPEPTAEAVDHIGTGQEIVKLRAVNIEPTGDQLGIAHVRAVQELKLFNGLRTEYIASIAELKTIRSCSNFDHNLADVGCQLHCARRDPASEDHSIRIST